MRVLGYARVSSVAQADGTSLRDQQAAIQRYAAARGLKVDRFYVEAESAVYEKIERRGEMRALLAAVRRGDLVLCDKVDRWSRDPEFTYRTVRELLAAGVGVYFVTDQCDPATSDGDTMLGARVWFAREEHKRIKQRLVGTRKILRNQGYYVEGLPPLGYVRPKTSDRLGHNVLAVDPVWAPVVRELFARSARGQSISEILTWAQAAHTSRAWDKKTINLILRNRVYLGEYRDADGVWHAGRHEAIISSALFARVQRALDSRKLGGARASLESRTASWLLREIGACAKCGAKISAAYGAGEPYRYYYRCPGSCPGYARVEDQDRDADELTLERLAALRTRLAAPPKAPPPAKDVGAKRDALQRKRERFLEAFADGDMTRDELRAALAKVDAARDRLEAEAQAAPARDPAEVLAQVTTLAKAWRKATVAEKREILKLIARRVLIAKGQRPKPEWIPVEELVTEP